MGGGYLELVARLRYRLSPSPSHLFRVPLPRWNDPFAYCKVEQVRLEKFSVALEGGSICGPGRKFATRKVKRRGVHLKAV